MDIGFVEGDLTGLTVKGVNILEYSIDYYLAKEKFVIYGNLKSNDKKIFLLK